MAKVLVTDTHLTNIANAIRSKKGTSDTYKPSEMANAISNIETGSGGDTSMEDGIITRQGTTYINDRVTSIGHKVFMSNNVIQHVSFANVTVINSQCFQDCAELLTANFPKLNTLAGYGFYGCSKVITFDFPMLASVPAQGFRNCTSLTKFILRKSDGIASMGNVSAFQGTPIASGTGYIYVPDDLVDSYKSATNWSTYASQIKPLSELEG